MNKETVGGRSGLHLISGTMWWIKACVFNTIVCFSVGFLPHKVSTSDIFLFIYLFVYENEEFITWFLVWSVVYFFQLLGFNDFIVFFCIVLLVHKVRSCFPF